MTAKANAIHVIWLGTAGILLSDEETSILIDPYVSRCGFFKVAMGIPLKPDRQAIRKWTDFFGKNIRAVCISHSHFDHCLDAPFFAKETGAVLMGSESALNVGRGASLPEERLVAAVPGREMAVGSFRLVFIESRHGPAFLSRVPYPGRIDKPLTGPRPAGDYKLGQVYAIHLSHPCGTIVHHGSAGFIPGMYEGKKADIVLLGITGRGDTHAYLKNVPLELGARLVIPIHFDNFFLPLKKKLKNLPGTRLKEFYAAAGRYQKHFALRVLPVGEKAAILSVPEGDDHENIRTEATLRLP